MTAEQSTTSNPGATGLDETTVLGRNKRILLAALKQGGASTATVTYTGSGDSGSVEDVSIQTTENAEFDSTAPIIVFAEQGIHQDGTWLATVVEQQMPIEQALQDFAESALERLYGGWEDGDGASGSVIFDCRGDTVRIEHTAYYTDSDYVETTL